MGDGGDDLGGEGRGRVVFTPCHSVLWQGLSLFLEVLDKGCRAQ
jgi:hypothetical protein